MSVPLLEARGLVKHFPIRSGLLQGVSGAVRAVDGVDFAIPEGAVYGLAGESGSGKSTIARLVVGLYQPSGGEILLSGQPAGRRSHAFRRQVQMVFQNPGSSLNPRRSIGRSLEVPLRYHDVPRGDWPGRIARLLESVELPAGFAGRYPHELSGGQKQRVAIARALAVEPRLVVLDEPTSALDVSVQAKIIELLMDLAARRSLTFLFISHDLSLMRNFADLIGVLYLGRLVESGPTEAVFNRPAHPYTQSLIASVPVISAEEEALKPNVPAARGEIPSPSRVPPGCAFHTRCPLAEEICRSAWPEPREFETSGHVACCHLARPNRSDRRSAPC